MRFGLKGKPTKPSAPRALRRLLKSLRRVECRDYRRFKISCPYLVRGFAIKVSAGLPLVGAQEALVGESPLYAGFEPFFRRPVVKS